MKLETASSARDDSRKGKPGEEAPLTREDRRLLLRYMLLMRAAEERGAHPLQAGQGAGLLLRRARPGGDLGRRRLRARPARPHVHPAPRPRRALRARRDPGPLPGQLHGPRRRRHRRQGRQHAFRRPPAGLRRHGLDAARHGPGRDRHGARVQDAQRAARRDDVLRRGLHGQRPVARGDELRRHPPAAGRSSCSRTTGSPTRRRTSWSSPSTRSSGRTATASRASASTATTSRRCSTRPARQPSARARATARR